MNKNIIKKLLVLILITQCMAPKSLVYAEVQDFPTLNMELNIPEDTVIISKDTLITDEKWNLAGIIDPISEIKLMKQMGVQAILFDPKTKTKVSLLSKQSEQSKKIFHLSTLTDKELNDFLANIIDLKDNITTYNVEKYSQKETTFFRLYIETAQNNLHFKELVYGTIVNGSIISFHIYQDNKLETAMNESYISSLVDGIHFTKYYPKEEVKKQERLSTIFRMASFVVLLLSVAIWILLLRKKKLKYNALTKRKAEEISKFYLRKKEMGENNTKSTILFLNCSEYSENVFYKFSLYNEVISKIKQWIKLSVLYIFILLLLKIVDSGFLSYILIVLLIFIFIYLKKASIEKLVNREMKIFNISERMEVKFQFYEDYLSMSVGQQNIIYPYLQIIKVREYKNFIYLYLDINKAIYLNKDGFDLNTANFITFIKQKAEMKL